MQDDPVTEPRRCPVRKKQSADWPGIGDGLRFVQGQDGRAAGIKNRQLGAEGTHSCPAMP